MSTTTTGASGTSELRSRMASGLDALSWQRHGPYVALLVLGLAVLPGYANYLTPDGISYLSIAEHYAAGRFGDALNAYWSPLFSWLLAPLVLVGIPAVLGAKLLNLAVAAAALHGVRRLARRFGVGGQTVAVLSWALVVFLVAAAFTFLTPDLLVAVPVLFYLARLVDDEDVDGWRRGVALGGWAALAYFAKLFALPALLVHLPVATVLLVWRGGRDRAAWRTLAAAFAALAVVAGAWSAALYAKYDFVTLGTAASANLRTLDPDAWGLSTFWEGFLEPPHPDATSAWEDPTLFPASPTGKAAGEVGQFGAQTAVGTLIDNIDDSALVALGWLPVLALVASAPWLLRATARRGKGGREDAKTESVRASALVVVAAAAIWTGGLLLSFPQTRYHWAPLLMLAPVAGLALDRLRRRRRTRSMYGWVAAALVLWLLPVPVADLAREWRATDTTVEVAQAVDPQLELRGTRLASNSQWGAALTLCYIRDCQYLGVPPPQAPPVEVAAELAAEDADYYLIADGQVPVFLQNREPALVLPRFGLVFFQITDAQAR